MSSPTNSNSVLPEAGSSKLVVAGPDHTKHKRRRRGKKRRIHKGMNESYASENNVNQMSDTDENQALENDIHNSKNKRCRGILIRPVNVPKAPENSTQFIIDDHKGCGLYFSFETPNPYIKNEELETSSEAELCKTVEDAAFQDIDYKYESPQDLDYSAYYTQDFETAYTTSRHEELMRLSRQELVAALEKFHTRLQELEEDLVKYDPSPVLETFQHKLLDLQEEHAALSKSNSGLKVMFVVESNESVSEQSLEEDVSGNEEMEVGEPSDTVESTSDQLAECSIPGYEESYGVLKPSEEVSTIEESEQVCDPVSSGNETRCTSVLEENPGDVAEPVSESFAP